MPGRCELPAAMGLRFGAAVGEGTKIWHQAQLLPGAVLGRYCTVGKGAFLSRTARVGGLVTGVVVAAA